VDSDDGYFDERVAARYDESTAEMFDPAVVNPAVDFLVELAGSGRALELGIGTGRIALPLARRGVPVHGIELSNAMVARLREKPGGEDIGVTIGDFATTTAAGTFSVAYLVFNTISNLTTQAAQVACFRNVAAHLEPGGCFVIEVGIPARHLARRARSDGRACRDEAARALERVAAGAVHERQPQARLGLGEAGRPLD
jgi:SAM-dependent methyltransferase